MKDGCGAHLLAPIYYSRLGMSSWHYCFGVWDLQTSYSHLFSCFWWAEMTRRKQKMIPAVLITVQWVQHCLGCGTALGRHPGFKSTIQAEFPIRNSDISWKKDTQIKNKINESTQRISTQSKGRKPQDLKKVSWIFRSFRTWAISTKSFPGRNWGLINSLVSSNTSAQLNKAHKICLPYLSGF